MQGLPFSVTPELQSYVEGAIDSLNANPDAAEALEAVPQALRDSIPFVFACSDFIAKACARDPAMLANLAGSAPAIPELSDDESQAMERLRRWRQRSLVRIAWRDLMGWATLEETLLELSDFADAAIDAAARYARWLLVARYGEPRSATAEIQPLVILAMGKLGGRELNFSSDVDLVMLFPEFGDTDGPRPTSNDEFFIRLGQALIRMLETPTQDGFVLRVDMRLRPFGDSGPLVSSFASFEDYLPRHGRDWERYAYVKARPVTEAGRYQELFGAAVRPFVYRRYLDYGVFESLREMKGLIEREVERRELADHVKLGPGGIREIEFIVQAFQLIRGGRDRRLRTSSLFAALAVLESTRILPPQVVAELRAAYVFLRRLENRLQMVADAQVHQLPIDALTRERIAIAMGYPSWEALGTALDQHRARVNRHFRLVVFGGQENGGDRQKIDLGSLWESHAEAAPVADVLARALAETLGRAGFVEAEEAARLLVELRASAPVRRLDEPGRKRLQGLLPVLLADVAHAPADSQTAVLRRVLRISEAIGQRSTYFALLAENGPARSRLVELCRHGDFLASQIAAHPMLLDELIEERLLSHLPDRAALAEELELRMSHVQEDDPEHQIEALRQFQRAAIFRVAVADLTGRLPVMRVSDRLTEVAELIVEQAMQLAWHQITQQFGTPFCGEGAERREVTICAIGYGKLGGIELSYSSDLDLVFLHDSRGERQETSGARPIDNQLFFVRLAQRIVHLLTTHSSAGRLYEVDVRLRPSGKGGMLVTNILAFAEYQQKEAWTWEHQALLHARAVAGAPALRASFEEVRMEVLRKYVKHQSLREEVRSMRERMRKELSAAVSGQFDIKQDAGGVADIEFLAQYWALRWAQDRPPVAMFSDTIRQLESVASADLVPQITVDVLTGAYRAYRTRSHHLSLAGRPALVPDSEFVAERAAITAIWDGALGIEAQAT